MRVANGTNVTLQHHEAKVVFAHVSNIAKIVVEDNITTELGAEVESLNNYINSKLSDAYQLGLLQAKELIEREIHR